jgi:hypothetical protein
MYNLKKDRMTKVRKIVVVEDHSTVDGVISFFRSKAGHGLIILLSCIVLTVLTTFLFADAMEDIRGWKMTGILIGVVFAVVFEISTFFLAVNGYNWASLIAAMFSIVICRATFSQMFPEIEWNNLYVASWIMSIFPPSMIAFTSHKMAEKYGLDELADLQSQTALSPNVQHTTN